MTYDRFQVACLTSVLYIVIMKIPILSTLAIGSIIGLAQAAPKKSEASMSKKELEVITEMNLARTKPADYAKFVEAHLRSFDGDKMYRDRGVNIMTQEGTAAVKEAIEFLKKAKPMPAMTPSEGLALAARDHANDTGPQGLTGHKGTDGSKPHERIQRHGKVTSTSGENISYGPDEARSIVMQLIIDDGVPNRGHRTNIFSSKFMTAGVAMGKHKQYKTMCVINYADAFAKK
jgi:uncharacterized protein YkwD